MALTILPASGAQRCMKCGKPATIEVYGEGQLMALLCQPHEDERKRNAVEHARQVARGTRPGRKSGKPAGQRALYDR